jgi:two-component system LytT family sensor kinase
VRKWAFSFGAATVLILVNSTALWFGLRSGSFPNNPPYSWRVLLLEHLAVWYPVALLAPGIIWFAERYQFERGRWARRLLMHLGLIAAFHLTQTIISVFLLRMLEWSEPGWTFSAMIRQRLFARVLVNLIIYWAIVGAGYAFDYYRRFREQELQSSQLEAQLAQAQLQALRMQLQPHFLFNTLHAISALMDDDVKAARQMIARLSELLRLTLDSAGRQEVTLRQELEVVELYLEIEQIRFQDRLQVRMDIAPGALEARVPNLVLQPVVENAIRHGIAPSSSAGRLEISAQLHDQTVELEVRDDGPGIKGGGAALQEGIGLSNTRARLDQLYGEGHRLEISNRPGGGVEVRIVIPFRRQASVAGDVKEAYAAQGELITSTD